MAADVPAETWISTSSAPVNDPMEGTKLAKPLALLTTLLWLVLRSTGIAVVPVVGSPGNSGGSCPAGRSTVD